MEAVISVQDVANIITLVAPGYFALKTYSIIYAKAEKDFSQLVLLSAIFSLPIVGAYSLVFGLHDVSTDIRYTLGLIVFSVVVGFVFARVRRFTPVRRLLRALRFPAAEEDFLKLQFAKISKGEPVTVKLKNGELFSGTPQGASKYNTDGDRQYFFNNVAWFVKKTKKWEEHPGSIIISLGEIEYFETFTPLPED
ncbi:MAG TPA: DUF6338 family protein [Patescibacteria group bacterium]|nr:DUF6338 family protein [Patescibacteria group bacterium]